MLRAAIVALGLLLAVPVALIGYETGHGLAVSSQAQQVPVKITIPLIFCILPTLFIAVMGPAVLSIMDSFSSK